MVAERLCQDELWRTEPITTLWGLSSIVVIQQILFFIWRTEGLFRNLYQIKVQDQKNNHQFLIIKSNGVIFSTKKFTFYLKKNAILCLFHKNVSASKRMIFFLIIRTCQCKLHCIAFYALYKSRMLIIPCKADDFCLLIGLPDEIL